MGKVEDKTKIDTVKARPYWHVDAKWFCGLIFMFIFSINLFAFGLYQITNEKNGIDTITTMIALGFSRDGLDSSKDIDKLRKQIEASPTKTLKPNPALKVTLSKSDIEGKTPREIRLMIFRQVATPIYFNGKGAEEVLNTPEARANFEKDTALLRVFSENSHKTVGYVLLILSFVSAVFLGLVVFFSSRFGRIANPGFNIFSAAWFWAILFTILRIASSNVTDMKLPIPGEAGSAYGQMLAPFVREVLPSIFSILSAIYITAAITGIGLLALAGLSKAVFRIKTAKKES